MLRKIIKKVLGKRYKYLKIILLVRLKWNGILSKYFNFLFIYPKVINLNATEYCNSHCLMCDIWKNDKNIKHLSISQYDKIFKNKLFKKVQHVGITGGEPTLRDDLAKIFESAGKYLPSLRGLSMITNAIDHENVIRKIADIDKICKKHRKTFSVMVSLDGIGKYHDINRGKKGNFNSVLIVINYLKNCNINFSIGSTITKKNVWDVDDILIFLKKENIEGRFRVAEFINRLNNKNSKVIRNFDEEETYHLSTFFLKLIYDYEQNEGVKRTYKSIIEVLNGKHRLISCPYKTRGVVLNGFGDISYCAPKSELIGNTIKNDAFKIFKKNIFKRKHIISKYCSNCIHDYHAPITYNERKKELIDIFWHTVLTINNIHLYKIFVNFSKQFRFNKNILITGWYGTETTGDKAILGGIYKKIKKEFPKHKIIISSLNPLITNKTIKELKINAEIINVYSYKFIRYSSISDIVIMGGGPLMDIEALWIPLWAFKLAKKKKRRTIIFGCGLGPLYMERYKKVVKEILCLADDIWLRDNESLIYAKSILENANSIKVIKDPAIPFIKSLKKNNEIRQQKYLSCFLREWTFEYCDKKNLKFYQDKKDKFEFNLAILIKNICKRYDLIPAFYPMHTFSIGGDDRDFYRNFISKYFKFEDIYFYKKNSNISVIKNAMEKSKLNLCMRYHSVVFADVLDANYIAIDYTNGGKIFGYLSDKNKLGKSISLDEIINFKTEQLLDKINV